MAGDAAGALSHAAPEETWAFDDRKVASNADADDARSNRAIRSVLQPGSLNA